MSLTPSVRWGSRPKRDNGDALVVATGEAPVRALEPIDRHGLRASHGARLFAESPVTCKLEK